MPNKRKSTSSTACLTLPNSKQVKLTSDNKKDELIGNVEELYEMKMPKDFKFFWKLCLDVNPKNPLG